MYIYGSHDRFDEEDFCMNDYVCWSAPIDDLGAWKKEGVIYRSVQDPLNEDDTQHLFAPDVQVGEDGRYYLFYCLHRSPTVSVAVCDEPAGEYQFYGHIRYADGTLYGQKQGDVFNFDPGVLRDDNGRKSEPVLAVPGEVLSEGTDFEGQWYVFYHRHTNRYRNSRQMCAGQIKIAEDGKIAQTEITSCGLNGGPLQGTGRYEARIACNLSSAGGTFMYQKEKTAGEEMHPYFTQDGEDREDNPNQYIVNLRDGAWAGFKYFDIRQNSQIRISVRGNAEGEMLVQDEKDGEIRAVIPVHPSADWQWFEFC